ncbi:MAG: hypothetical protein IKU00_01220 [Bacteroidales bacterium]|nr:hypothetical protein [Bacteroidales bacterium]
MKKVKVICMALLAMICMVSCRGPKTNANVFSSTVTVYSSDWYWDNTSWRVDIEYDAIDLAVNSYGAVLVYMNNENTWRQIPMTYYYTDISNGQTIYCSSSLEVSSYQGGVSIFWTENDFYNGKRPTDHQFKIVALSSVDFSERSDVDFSNYEAVKEAFQLND